MPDLRLAPYRKLKTLANEIVPWGPFMENGRPDQMIENQDEVLAYLARKDEREYVRMERAEPIVHNGILRRTRTLLSAGWKLEPANNSKAARLLLDHQKELFKRLKSRLAVNLTEMHRAIFTGWRPLERIWDFDDTFQGRPAWFIKAIRAKNPWDFRFTANRDLVWVGNVGGSGYVHFPMDDDAARLRWMICTAGSSDAPYGIGELRYVWMLYYLKREFIRLWSQGVQRSLGTVRVKQTGTSALGSLSSREAQGAAGAPGQGNSVVEIAKEFASVIKVFQESGVLIQRNGWEVELSGDVSYADGWKEPLSYLDRMMALCLTGDTLSLSAGTVGSRAAAETKSEELEQLCVADGHEIAGWINEQIVAESLRLQFSETELDPDDFPEFTFNLGHSADLDAAKWLFTAGARLDGKKLAAEYGVPLVIDEQPDDVVLEKQQLVLDPLTGRPVPMATAPPVNGAPGAKPPQDPAKPGAPPAPGGKAAAPSPPPK